MNDVLGVALAIIAATLLLDDAIPRKAVIATGVWSISAAVLATRHGSFPGIAYAVAALTATLSLAILVAPLAPRALRLGRFVAAAAAIIAVITGVIDG